MENNGTLGTMIIVLAALLSYESTIPSVLCRRNARETPESAGKTRLRRELTIKSNLSEGSTLSDHRFRHFEPSPANVTMGRHAHGARKRAGEMEDAKTCNLGEVGDGDVFSKVLFDVSENTVQPRTIELVGRLRRTHVGSTLATFCTSRAARFSDTRIRLSILRCAVALLRAAFANEVASKYAHQASPQRGRLC
jgi:hypothetical protein